MRGAAGQHLVEDRAEREHVAAAVGVLARAPARAPCTPPSRGAGRARSRPPGGAGTSVSPSVSTPSGALHLREAEVEDLDPAVAGQEHVVGLEVAVDDVLAVRRGEAVRDAGRDLGGLARRDRPRAIRSRSVSPSSSSVTRYGAPVVRAEVVDDEHVRVVEGAGGAGLLLEAPQPVGVGGERGGQDLDRDDAAEARVERAVDLAHAAVGQRRRRSRTARAVARRRGS